MIGNYMLEIHETNATDESIKSYEYNEYQPITGSQLNGAGQITITIENQDQFLHLHNSYNSCCIRQRRQYSNYIQSSTELTCES